MLNEIKSEKLNLINKKRRSEQLKAMTNIEKRTRRHGALVLFVLSSILLRIAGDDCLCQRVSDVDKFVVCYYDVILNETLDSLTANSSLKKCEDQLKKASAQQCNFTMFMPSGIFKVVYEVCDEALRMDECLAFVADYMDLTTPSYATADCRNCCDPAERPGMCGRPECMGGDYACCSDGTWACRIGNSYACDGLPTGTICLSSKVYCNRDEVQICPDGITVVRRDPLRCCEFESCIECCNPQSKPGTCGVPSCEYGEGCCEDGSWSCANRDGSFYCAGKFVTTAQGTVCELSLETSNCSRDYHICPDGTVLQREPSNCCSFPSCPASCCLLEKEPGQNGIEPCLYGHVCCADGSWTCGRHDGTFVCDTTVVDSKGNGKICAVQSRMACDPDVMYCPDGSTIARDPDNACNFPPCPACCDPYMEPGQCGNENLCSNNLYSCCNGQWQCGAECSDVTSITLACESTLYFCSPDTILCTNGTRVHRNPEECCNFPEC